MDARQAPSKMMPAVGQPKAGWGDRGDGFAGPLGEATDGGAQTSQQLAKLREIGFVGIGCLSHDCILSAAA
jgi:hypothetical protein